MAISKHKGYKPKQRNTGNRPRKSIIFIATEGKNKTETQYFRDLAKAQRQRIVFAHGNHTDPVNMVNELKQELLNQQFDPELGDKAYCLVDSDVNPKKDSQLSQADTLSKRNGTQLIVSSPCFEVWYLCHFGCYSKHYPSSNADIADLCDKFPGYRKNGEGLYNALSKDTLKAIENAKRLEQICIESGYAPHSVEFSPSSEVYKVVEAIIVKDQKGGS